MYRIVFCFIALFIAHSTLHAQPHDSINYAAPGENIYKHFTGTVGNKKATIDLRYGFQAASNFGGSSCYLPDEGELDFFLISKPQTQSHKELLRAQVFPENIPLSDISNAYSVLVQTSRFEFNLSNDSLIGKWLTPAVQDMAPMIFKEDNTGAFRAVFAHATDSATETGRKNEKETAKAIFNGIRMVEDMNSKDRVFINSAFASFLGAASPSKKDPPDLSQICMEKFLSDFRHAVNSGNEQSGSGFTADYTLFPVFSDNGFLVLQLGGYHYDFDNKEYTDKNTYLCLDLQNRQTLHLSDLLEVNNDALAILENIFRAKYQIDPAKKLSDFFIAGKMPLTDNFILLNTGLIFSYSPAKVFRDDQEISSLQEMRLFVPYSKLGGMLKPEFKERVGVVKK